MRTLLITAAMAAGILCAAITAQTPAADAPAMPSKEMASKDNASRDISADTAQKVVMAAVAKAKELRLKQDIAIVDAGGNLKAFIRMDGAWLGSIDIAIKKAKTARYFDMPTGEIGKLSQPGGPLYGIEVTNNGLVSFPGGIPIKDADGTIIGAIGSSGSTVDNDAKVAEAGVAAAK